MLKRIILLSCSLFLASAAFAGDSGYKVKKKIKIGGEGGWDYLTVDAATRRLYVSRATHVLVLDLDKNKVVGDIPDTQGVHGIALAPEFNRGFISCGKANKAVIFDVNTLKVLGKVETGANPDAILYDPSSRKVFTFNGRSKDATVFDAGTGLVVSTITLGGKPEFAVADGKGKVYVNIEDTSEIVEIDTAHLMITNRFQLYPGKEPSGLAIDVEHGLLFSGCRNKMMTVFDVNAMKLITTVPIGEGVDGNGYDTASGLAFSSNGDGTLTVARQTPAGNFEVIGNVETQRGARTMAIDPQTHNIYLPTAKFSPAPAGKKERPQAVKDTFVILVVGK